MKEDLRGKRLLVVFGSYRSKRHIYEHARELGVRLVVIDGPDHWMKAETGADRLIEHHLVVDLAPFSTLADRAVEASKSTGLVFDALGTIDEFAGGFAARIARDLNLPFHSIQAADTARDKHRARKVCATAGIAGPRFARIESEADLQGAADAVGFPAVLKPVSGVGSVQAYRVSSVRQLRQRYLEVTAARPSAATRLISSKSSDSHWFELMWSGVPHLILESWIEGPKFDVDLLLEEGHVKYAHATDDLDPCGLRDVRRVAPTDLNASEEEELIAHAAACVRAMAFRDGAFNVEVKRTVDGPRMIEVNGRLGGYSTTDIHREVWRVDLIEQWLRTCLRVPLRPAAQPPACFVAESLLPAPRSGTVARDGFLSHVAEHADVVSARPWIFEGDQVAGIETHAPDWLGAVLIRGETREEALARLDHAVSSLTLPIIVD